MKKMMGIICLLSLAGCVTDRPVSLPNGAQGFAVQCPGLARDWADCMNHAAEVCHGPYHIVDQNGESNAGMVTPVGNSAVYARGVKRTMIVECGK